MIHVQKGESFVLAFLSSTVPVKCRCRAVPPKYILYLKPSTAKPIASLNLSFHRLWTEVQALDTDNTIRNNHSSLCFLNAHIFIGGILLFK